MRKLVGLYTEVLHGVVRISVERKNKYEISFYSSLQKLEKSLPDYFIRCHRSYIVNFMFIQKADLINGEFYLNKKTVIPISQKYKAKLAKML